MIFFVFKIKRTYPLLGYRKQNVTEQECSPKSKVFVIIVSESCPPVETDPASASCSPVWNATLGFGGLTADLLAGRALELTLWDACPGIDPVLIGECTVGLICP